MMMEEEEEEEGCGLGGRGSCVLSIDVVLKPVITCLQVKRCLPGGEWSLLADSLSLERPGGPMTSSNGGRRRRAVPVLKGVRYLPPTYLPPQGRLVGGGAVKGDYSSGRWIWRAGAITVLTADADNLFIFLLQCAARGRKEMSSFVANAKVISPTDVVNVDERFCSTTAADGQKCWAGCSDVNSLALAEDAAR